VDWPSLILSLQLALGTLLVLMPLGIFVGRWLAWRHFKGKSWVQALFALPLVLPPTVLGFFLLYLFSNSSAAGRLYQSIAGQSLAFSLLMVGGNIPEETRTIAISIYDSVQAFDNRSAAIMSFALLALSTVAIALVYSLSGRSASAKPGF